MAFKYRIYHKWWIYRKIMYVRYNKLGDPGFNNMFWSWHQWEIVYKICSFSFTIHRDYHKPGCPCDRMACEEARH